MGSNPKYRVGEEVVIQSEARPELNGTVLIVDAIFQREEAFDRLRYATKKAGYSSVSGSPDGIIGRAEWSYRLNGFDYELFNVDGSLSGIVFDLVAETSLRRHHRPATRSFAQLMADPGGRIHA